MSRSASERPLGDLLAETQGAELVHGGHTTPISGVTQDTRRLQPGDVFVAIPGFQKDGSEFVTDALSQGAAAIVIQRPPPELPLPLGEGGGEGALGICPSGGGASQTPLVLVPDARAALADLSAAFYGHPSRYLPVVGVTGTDGKTSTTHLLSGILEARGLRTGWLTTINTKIGSDLRSNTAEHTTPEAPLVQRTLAEMRDAQLDVAIVETSSHALALDRVRATHFAVGIFTNLSPEHLNFHGSFDAYRAAKRRLFEQLPPDGLAVLNADDPSSHAMRAATRARVLTYGLDQPADVSASDLRLSPGGTTFTLQPGNGPVISTRLIGRFNVSNWLAAYAAATWFGATPGDLAAAAATQLPVPGRMNLVEQGQPFAVVVDFAHTPQALGKALDTLRVLVSGRILLGFGLAGGRDVSNRSTMGALAARKADYFLITTDDPGTEDPAAIAAEIAAGAQTMGRHNFGIELDRRAALRRLFEQALPGDAVLLAGKGHEQRMIVGDGRVPWNDARAASEVLAELGFRAHPAFTV